MNDSVLIFLGSKVIDNSRQFENHQLGFIENLYANNVINFKHVIMGVYIPSPKNKTEELNIRRKTKMMEELSKKYSFGLDIIYIEGKTFRSIFDAIKEFKEKATPFKFKFIFSQNYHSGFIGLRIKQLLKNTYYHSNLRGVPAEEELFYSDSILFKRILNFIVLKWIEKKIIPRADSISVVSKEYRKYLKEKFKDKIKDVIIYPCAYNTQRLYINNNLGDTYRKKYGIEKEQKVLIYSGSLNKYQLPAKIFHFFSNISKQDEGKNWFFIFLTLDKQAAKHFSKTYKIQNLIVESASGEDLLGFYNASDIGIILRRKDLVNRVASPTKVAEYLATGNSIILTEGIGDFSSELRGKKFALIKKNQSEFLKTNINELLNLESPDINDLNWVKENYSSEIVKVYNQIFI
ncbi:MAG: hypothetical protein ACFFD1_09330 [Candidatus Thorarchaeota archaeon]